MSDKNQTSGGLLPSYITSATPNPQANRAPWYKNTAPTYAGIMLWFVFWLGATDFKSAGSVFAHGWLSPWFPWPSPPSFVIPSTMS